MTPLSHKWEVVSLTQPHYSPLAVGNRAAAACRGSSQVFRVPRDA